MNEDEYYFQAKNKLEDIFKLYENMIGKCENIFTENIRSELAEDCVNAALEMYDGDNPIRFLMTMKGEIDRKIKELETN